MNVNENGFTLAIVDESNSLETTYLVTVTYDTESISSDWDTSRCRVFENLPTGKNFTIRSGCQKPRWNRNGGDPLDVQRETRQA